jgi:transcriptional regulator with XRE-family HTH domain
LTPTIAKYKIYTVRGEPEHMKKTNINKELGKLLKLRRASVQLTLCQLADMTGISPSHLGRIETGGRYPSAYVLQKIAKPLGLEESELFSLAGYLSQPLDEVEEDKPSYVSAQIDPYVSRVLSNESPEVQRTVIGILSILKSIAKTYEGEKDNKRLD